MRIHIISNKASWFQAVHSLCRSIHSGLNANHLSEEHWQSLEANRHQATDVFLSQPRESGKAGEAQNSGNAFAVIGTVCHNNDSMIHWQSVSRNDFVLWLRDLSPMITEATISEEVIFQTPHARLAQIQCPTRCRLIPGLRDRLMAGLRDYHVVEGTRENHFCMALEEALNNAFYHGNLEISSELKEDGSSRFIELAAEREQLSPWCNRRVFVTELVSAFGLWITIQDEGHGFNVEAALERCNDPEALLASGRGLLLMRGFSDEIFFSKAGNEVTLVLYGEGEDRELPLGTNDSVGTERRLVVA